MGTARWSEEDLARHLDRRPRAYEPPAFTRPRPVERAFWPIVPTPAPRQVRSDAWEPRPRVKRYRAFRDAVKRQGVWAPTPGDLVVFLMPMPKSWSKKRRAEMIGQPHLPRPDTDNLWKSLCDACYGEDSHIWTLVPVKIWSDVPGIYIERREPAITIPFVEHVDLVQ